MLGYKVTNSKNFTSVDDGNFTGDKGRKSTIFFIHILFSDNKKQENSDEKPGKKKVSVIEKNIVVIMICCRIRSNIPGSSIVFGYQSS